VITTEPVTEYLELLRSAPDRVLAEMETHARREGIPIVVPATGQLLQVLALAGGTHRALEIGTAIGVSTLYIARGLADGGTVVSFEVDPERHAAAQDYLERAGVGDRVQLHLQDAREGLAQQTGEFDFAFMDGIKLQYGDYFEAVLPLLEDGAILVVDNVLQQGAVALQDGPEQVSVVRSFNERLLNHHELTATVTPVGDGVLIAVKR
jgi:predicted O-methyltransferase YrrM